MFFFLLVAICLAWFLLVSSYRPKTRFLSDFATLLDRPEFVTGFENTLVYRAFLKGEFRGRKVVVLLQNGRGKFARNLVVSMETNAVLTIESYAFTGDKGDREAELALFELEVKHELKLRHEEGCLKARFSPSLLDLSDCDTYKYHRVLEEMYTLAGSIERRAGSLRQTVPVA